MNLQGTKMHASKLALRFGAAAALAILSNAALANFTVYTSEASFNSATTGGATDGFSLIPLDFISSPSTRSAGSYGYTASSAGGLYGAGTAANPWLSTNLSGDTITFSAFSGGVQAIGGSFFGSDIFGAFLAGQSMTLTAVDSLGETFSQTISNATQSSFLGLVSTGSLVSLAVDIADRNAFVSIDNLKLAQVAAIPEPGTWMMLLAGLGALFAAAQGRSRNRSARP
jgi:PEP-CTERM motif